MATREGNESEILQYPVLNDNFQVVRDDSSSHLGYLIRGEVLFYKNILVIPTKSPIIPLHSKNFFTLHQVEDIPISFVHISRLR